MLQRIILLLISSRFFVSFGDRLDDYQCEPSETGYVVPDPEQCDRYALCTPEGVKRVRLCPDGYGLSQTKGTCDLLAKIDCSDREKLQKPSVKPGGGPCLRANGYFPVDPKKDEDGCSKFYDCRNGMPYLHRCPAGAVFDLKISSCVHPDQTTRAECNANEVLNFTCPTYRGISAKHKGRLRFGDHDRLPHPTDCSKFFACLMNGQPRLSSCQPPTVFNPETGFCDHYENVESCKGFYDDNELSNIIVTKINK